MATCYICNRLYRNNVNINLSEIEYLLEPHPVHTSLSGGFFLCLQGSSDIITTGSLCRITPGMFVINSPVIYLIYTNTSEDFRGIYISDKVESFYNIIRSVMGVMVETNALFHPFTKATDRDIELMLERRKQIHEKDSEMGNVNDKQKILYEKMISLLKQETLLEFLNIFYSHSVIESAEHPQRFNETVINFMKSISHNVAQNRTISFYAKEANLSNGRFSTIIKKHLGKSPSEIIATATVAMAKSMLHDHEKSIKEIAEELNFPEQFTFRKYFKHHTGISPRNYRMSIAPVPASHSEK